jgi:molybdopterin converting factor small subunit
VSINGQTAFIPGGNPEPGSIHKNGIPAKISDLLQEQDVIEVTKGANGITPQPPLHAIAKIPSPYSVTVNSCDYMIHPKITINAAPASPDTALADRDRIIIYLPKTLEEVILALGFSPVPTCFSYTVNGQSRSYSAAPHFAVNNAPADLSTALNNGDTIRIIAPSAPTISSLLGINEADNEFITIVFNHSEVQIPAFRYTILLNKQTAKLTDTAVNGASIDYVCHDQSHPTIGEVLLAVEFDPRKLSGKTQVSVLHNNQPAEFTTPIYSGDQIQLLLSPEVGVKE